MAIQRVLNHFYSPFTSEGKTLSREKKLLSVVAALGVAFLISRKYGRFNTAASGVITFYATTALWKHYNKEKPMTFAEAYKFLDSTPLGKLYIKNEPLTLSEACELLAVPKESRTDLNYIKTRHEIVTKFINENQSKNSKITPNGIECLINKVDEAFNLITSNLPADSSNNKSNSADTPKPKEASKTSNLPSNETAKLKLSLKQTLTDHARAVDSIAIKDDIMVSGSSDHSIKVWDLKSGKCVKTLLGHTNNVMSVVIYEKMIISGSYDTSIKVWDLETEDTITEKCITLSGHKGLVNSIAVHNDILVSGSSDKTIKVWDLKSGQCLQTLLGHKFAVNTVAFDGTTIVSGSSDGTIMIWDLKSGKGFSQLSRHAQDVSSVVIKDNIIVSGSFDSSIKIWDLKTGDCKKTLSTRQDTLSHKYGIYCVTIHDQMIFSCGADKTIKAWDITTGQCLQTLSEHESAVYSIAARGNTLYIFLSR